MTPLQITEAVALATGESLETIHRLGFQLRSESADDLEPEDLYLAVACPFCGGSCALPAGPVEPNLLAECDDCDVYFEFDPSEIHAAGPQSHLLASALPVGEAAA